VVDRLWARNTHSKERISTIDLHIITISNQLLLILKKNIFLFTKSYLNEEANRTESSPYVRVPYYGFTKHGIFFHLGKDRGI
jgi:hypothetical protein